MILRDIEIHGFRPYSDESLVSNDSNHLCDLFLNLIGRFKTKSSAKIVITLVKSDVTEQNGFVIKKYYANVLLDIVEYNIDFNYLVYSNLSIIERKQLIWNIIYNSLIDISNQLRWETDPIVNAYQKGINLNYKNVNSLFSGNIFFNEFKKYEIVSDFEINEVLIFLLLFDLNNKEISRTVIAKRDVSWGYYDLPELKRGKVVYKNGKLEVFYKKSIDILISENFPEIIFDLNSLTKAL